MAVKPGDISCLACRRIWANGSGKCLAEEASRVICIKYDFRLSLAAKHLKTELLNYEVTDIRAALKEMTSGRGPDVCIDAVDIRCKLKRN